MTINALSWSLAASCVLLSLSSPLFAQTIVSPAAQVDLTHLGAHTHQNFIRFNTGSRNITPGQGLRLVAHCRLSTDHAALPPGFGALMQDTGPIPTSGPIERWGLIPDLRHGHGGVRVIVPTRFANWVAGQPASLRRHYQDRRSYSLEIVRSH